MSEEFICGNQLLLGFCFSSNVVGDVRVLFRKRGELPLEIGNTSFGCSGILTSCTCPSLEARDLHEMFSQFCYIPRIFLSEKADEVFVSCFGSEQ
jgi:hypothetical protein